MVQGAIAIIVGIWFLLVGLGKVKVSKKERANEQFRAKWGKFFRVAGPVLMAMGVAAIVISAL